jgi:hypothetical protein
MTSKILKCAVVLIAIGAPADVLAADASDQNNAGAAAARDNKAPPEKVAPNTATAPGVIAPKPTPDAGQIGAQGSASPGASNDGAGGTKGDLSDKPSNANGVIHPNSNVDPGIEKPAPAQGSMPIVRPPSAESGVQPK